MEVLCLLKMFYSFACSLTRHSATLLKNKLLIFGGRRTSVYLSDMHILDLGKKVCAIWLPWECLFQDRGLGVRCAQWENSNNIIKTPD